MIAGRSMMMNWATPPEDFQFVLFERVDRAENIARYYFVAWLPTLIDEGAVVRMYGRKGGGTHRVMSRSPLTRWIKPGPRSEQ